MRIEGTLKTWHDDRGFGFIAPTQGGQEVFVHVSAFPRDGKRPMAGEPLSFEVTLTDDGKKRAVRVERPHKVQPQSWLPRTSSPPRNLRLSRSPSSGGSGWRIRAVVIALLVALCAAGYERFLAPRVAAQAVMSSDAPSGANMMRDLPVSSPMPVSFTCDGRQHCSQMKSCAEATYFLKNCPNTRMDGDRDGIPCEEQWCTGQ